jgi:hypothetical protein
VAALPPKKLNGRNCGAVKPAFLPPRNDFDWWGVRIAGDETKHVAALVSLIPEWLAGLIGEDGEMRPPAQKTVTTA